MSHAKVYVLREFNISQKRLNLRLPRDANFFTLFNFTIFFQKSLEMLVSQSSQQMGQNLLHLKLSESKGTITLCDLFFCIDAMLLCKLL